MKIKFKKVLILIASILFIVFFVMYTSSLMNVLSENKDHESIRKKLEELNLEINLLEDKAKGNERNLGDLERIYQNFINERNRNQMSPSKPSLIDKLLQKETHGNKALVTSQSQVNPFTVSSNIDQCAWQGLKATDADIDMFKLYEEMSFDDVDGGVWKQGWPITYDASKWTPSDKLNVIIMPHSHNDPGWLKTYDEYFETKTRSILDTIVNALSESPDRKFVWAETSYLYLWWTQSDVKMKDKMRALITNGQLEIVTGGWVMNDEANSHYYSMIEQMVQGHESCMTLCRLFGLSLLRLPI